MKNKSIKELEEELKQAEIELKQSEDKTLILKNEIDKLENMSIEEFETIQHIKLLNN